MLKRISLILLLLMSLSYAKTDIELAGEVMTKATEEKARYEALNTITAKNQDRLNRMELELFVDKILFVVLACVKISL
jgi:hypothetical protein